MAKGPRWRKIRDLTRILFHAHRSPRRQAIRSSKDALRFQVRYLSRDFHAVDYTGVDWADFAKVEIPLAQRNVLLKTTLVHQAVDLAYMSEGEGQDESYEAYCLRMRDEFTNEALELAANRSTAPAAYRD